MTDRFLTRWSRRKLDVQDGKPVLAEPLAPAVRTPASQSHPDSSPVSRTAQDAPVGDAAVAETPPEVPLPTLEDARALTLQSDFKPFMARGVAAEVKNAAMKKLFTDPHYNVMDRLDTYIDDYSLPDPIPEAMLRQMVSAKFLNLFNEDDKQDTASQAALQLAATSAPLPHPSPNALTEPLRDDANTPTGEVVAQLPVTLQPQIDHDHPDMRLQPDHALKGESPRRGVG